MEILLDKNIIDKLNDISVLEDKSSEELVEEIVINYINTL